MIRYTAASPAIMVEAKMPTTHRGEENGACGPPPSSPGWKRYANPNFHLAKLPAPSSFSSRTDHPIARLAALEMEARIEELQRELELERRVRKRAESLNRVLAKELAEERRARATAEAEAARIAAVVSEKRDMLRVAEVLREERVQMKLKEAPFLMEKSLQQVIVDVSKPDRSPKAAAVARESLRSNPLIKRGLEKFPKVARGGRPTTRRGKSDMQSVSLECQKAQLKALLKHKSPSSLGLAAASHENLVM